MNDRCLACGDEFDGDSLDSLGPRFLCDECWDVERELVIEGLVDE
jgi:hypothetical protein